MLGRGLVSMPDLAQQIAAARADMAYTPMPWAGVLLLVQDFWLQVRERLTLRSAPGLLKQWLGMLARNYPEAFELFNQVRRETALERIDILLGMHSPYRTS